MVPPQANEQQRGLDLRLTTFNLLAPCYKRMHADVVPPGTEVAATGLLAAEAKSRRTSRESEFTELWRERAIQTVRGGKLVLGTRVPQQWLACVSCEGRSLARVAPFACVP